MKTEEIKKAVKEAKRFIKAASGCIQDGNQKPIEQTTIEYSNSKTKSGLVPAGAVRLNANIRRDLHKRLKDAAAKRQYEIGRGFTIRELIEELVEKHI